MEETMKDLQQKHLERIKLSQKICYQNQRKVELDLLLRKFNVKNIREVELKAANERVREKSEHWQSLLAEIEANLNACDEIKESHDQNLENYHLIMNALDPEAFKLKTQ